MTTTYIMCRVSFGLRIVRYIPWLGDEAPHCPAQQQGAATPLNFDGTHPHCFLLNVDVRW